MACSFTVLPTIKSSLSWPTMVASDHCNNKGEPSFGNKPIFRSQRNINLQDHLTVANVASLSPAVAPPPPESSGSTDRRHHVAWTSIPQERWEGELVVEGEIPLWLVRLISVLRYSIWLYHKSTESHETLTNKVEKESIHVDVVVIKTTRLFFSG